MTTWKRCNTDLPSDNRDVLVCIKGNQYIVGHYDGDREMWVLENQYRTTPEDFGDNVYWSEFPDIEEPEEEKSEQSELDKWIEQAYAWSSVAWGRQIELGKLEAENESLRKEVESLKSTKIDISWKDPKPETNECGFVVESWDVFSTEAIATLAYIEREVKELRETNYDLHKELAKVVISNKKKVYDIQDDDGVITVKVSPSGRKVSSVDVDVYFEEDKT